MIVSCMGGWCRKRDECAHYHSRSRVRSERLCERGKDTPDPIRKPSFDAWLAGATEAQIERFRLERLRSLESLHVSETEGES